jgi:hypothetical protein
MDDYFSKDFTAANVAACSDTEVDTIVRNAAHCIENLITAQKMISVRSDILVEADVWKCSLKARNKLVSLLEDPRRGFTVRVEAPDNAELGDPCNLRISWAPKKI